MREVPSDFFYKDNQSWCKTCLKSYERERGRLMKLKAVEIKGGRCQTCGYNKFVDALEFHHKNPAEKDFRVAQNRVSLHKLKQELEKCDMLCANCHREVHHLVG